jgi:methylmalonyl-CoA mutase
MTRRSDPRCRLLTAVAICDGHDSAIMSVNQELVRAGAEVLYLGYHRSAAEIARAAVQEDVAAAGISSYNGGHVEFFRAVRGELEARGRPDMPLFGGGGATINRADAAALRRCGVERIYHAGTPLERIAGDLLARYGGRRQEPPLFADDDATLGRWLTLAEAGAIAAGAYQAEMHRVGERRLRGESYERGRAARRLLGEASAFESLLHGIPAGHGRPAVIGFAGPGGAGKSTLIDEIVLRFLRDGRGRVAVLSNDPSAPMEAFGLRRSGLGPGAEHRAPKAERLPGALLADRATMIVAQDDRVFQRSFATRGGDISPAVPNASRLLAAAEFDLILIESAGTGQESLPFPAGSVFETVLVMTPEYGARLQLEKLALLGVADRVVLNKADRPAAAAALREIRVRLERDGRAGSLYATVASRHRDPGVDALWEALRQREP